MSKYRILEHRGGMFEPQIWRWWWPTWEPLEEKVELHYVVPVVYNCLTLADLAIWRSKNKSDDIYPIIHRVHQ